MNGAYKLAFIFIHNASTEQIYNDVSSIKYQMNDHFFQSYFYSTGSIVEYMKMIHFTMILITLIVLIFDYYFYFFFCAEGGRIRWMKRKNYCTKVE